MIGVNSPVSTTFGDNYVVYEYTPPRADGTKMSLSVGDYTDGHSEKLLFRAKSTEEFEVLKDAIGASFGKKVEDFTVTLDAKGGNYLRIKAYRIG